MKHSGRIMLITGIVLFVFMLTSFLMMSDALQNSNRFGELYSGLLVFNTIGLLVLAVLIGLNLRRLVGQLRRKIPGSKMTFRMVATFSLLSVIPVLILYYFSLNFLHRGIDSWFDLRVEQALDDSLELSKQSIDLRMKELTRQTEQMAREFSGISDVEIPFEIDGYRSRSGAEELVLLTQQGTVIAYSLSDTSSLVPDRPDESILFQVRQGTSYIGLDTLSDKGLSVRVVVNIKGLGIENKPRILQALYPIPVRMNELANNVQDAYVKYKELSFLKDKLKISFILILTLVLLFSIFSVVWAAFYTATRLASPIRNLAEGTRSVAEGDYNTQLPVPGHDELGFLVSSFNEMTRRIAGARDEVRQSQLEAEAQRSYLEAVLSRLSSGVLVLDQYKRLRMSNISSGQILGLEIESMTDRTLNEIGEEYRYLEQLLQTIDNHLKKSDSDWREQVTLFGTSGRQILMCSGTSLSLAGEKDTGHVIVFDDITALIQGQRDAAWSEMARRLAHEIKNPLTPIQLAAERLRHKYLYTLRNDQKEMLDRLTNTIIQQVETMKAMVNSFSEYARPPVITMEKVDLNRILQEVVDLYSNLDTSAEIHTQSDAELPFIKADPVKLRQVFNNLLNNAFDASNKEDKTILDISTNRISDTGADYIEVRVRDSGSGLSKDIISTIFEPYVTTKKRGTGLGLAIVKKIIEEHGGIVILENNAEGKGACAIIRLPVFDDNVEIIEREVKRDVI